MNTLLSISEAQQRLSVSRSTINRLISKGEITCIHIGRSVRIPAEDIEAFVQRLRSAA